MPRTHLIVLSVRNYLLVPSNVTDLFLSELYYDWAEEKICRERCRRAIIDLLLCVARNLFSLSWNELFTIKKSENSPLKTPCTTLHPYRWERRYIVKGLKQEYLTEYNHFPDHQALSCTMNSGLRPTLILSRGCNPLYVGFHFLVDQFLAASFDRSEDLFPTPIGQTYREGILKVFRS